MVMDQPPTAVLSAALVELLEKDAGLGVLAGPKLLHNSYHEPALTSLSPIRQKPIHEVTPKIKNNELTTHPASDIPYPNLKSAIPIHIRYRLRHRPLFHLILG